MKEGFSFDTTKPWGSMRQFTLNEPTTVKLINVAPGEELSLQSHRLRGEFWRVISGSGKFVVGEEEIEASLGVERFVGQGEKHRIIAGENGIEVLEISFGEFDENDIIRYEDKYGRTKI